MIMFLRFGLYSQNTKVISEKCIVMGVDINCSLEIAEQRFEQKGFIAREDKHFLIGQFLNRKVTVQLTPDKDNKFIAWVGVFVTNLTDKDNPSKFYTSWNRLKTELLEISEELQHLYNVEYISLFEFASPYKEGDGNEFSAICSGKANVYSSFFLFKDGISLIKIYPTSVSIDKMMLIVHFYNEKAGLSNPS